MIGFRPQTVVLSILAIKAAGFRLSKDSKISADLLSEKTHFYIIYMYLNDNLKLNSLSIDDGLP